MIRSRSARAHAVCPLVSVIALAFSVSGLAGCAHVQRNAPVTVQADKTARYAATQFASDRRTYEGLMDQTDYARATVLRDRMISRIRVDIDASYATTEQLLFEGRAGFNTLADFVELALAGAGAITHGEEAKTVLATILSVTKGTRLSIDKNWFREKATESLINAMRAGRNARLAEIIRKMTANPADKYTFEEAWSDLIAYHQAGTLHGGLITLSASTGEQAAQSENNVRQANEPRYAKLVAATREMVTETGALADKALQLRPAQMREVLRSLGAPAAPAATDEQVRALINEQIQKLATATPAERQKIVEAINRF